MNKGLMIGTGILAGVVLNFIFRQSLRHADRSERKEKRRRRQGEGGSAAEVATIDPRPQASGEAPTESR
jgi:hypothetical protein